MIRDVELGRQFSILMKNLGVYVRRPSGVRHGFDGAEVEDTLGICDGVAKALETGVTRSRELESPVCR